MNELTLTCPYCGGIVPANTTTICPDCHEDLSPLIHLESGHLIRYNEGLALAREGRLEEAKACLAAALAHKESFAPAHILLAKIHAKEQRWPEAQASIKRALELAPEDERARLLAEEIQKAAQEAEIRRQEIARVRRANAERLLAASQRDALKAFGLGVGLTAFAALLISWLGGGKKRHG
jgi:tetratricopeptide (TPR) repeat protein